MKHISKANMYKTKHPQHTSTDQRNTLPLADQEPEKSLYPPRHFWQPS